MLIGTGTVAVDDPELTVRDEVDEPLARQPLRAVMGLRDIDPGRRVLNDRAETIHLRTRDPHEALAELYARDRQHVFLEGGPTLAAAFLGAGLVDEIVDVRRADAARLGPRRRRRPRNRHHRRRVASHRHRRHRAARPRRRAAQRPAHHDPRPTNGDLMFTGIVEELGTVEAVEDQGDAVRLTVRATTVLEDAGLGDSISVNGCCLTVAERTDDTWTADVMQETLDKTSLHGVAAGGPGQPRARRHRDKRLGGHIVQGHVDGVGTIVRRTPSEHWEVVEIAMPPELARYLVDKGSITVDGVSLTVVEAGEDAFTVSLIPETLARTTLGSRQPGDRVNLETDVIAKHVEKLITGGYVDRLLAAHRSENSHD